MALWVVLSVWRERMRIASHAANGSLSAVVSSCFLLAPSLQKPALASLSDTNTYSPGQRDVTKLPSSTGYQEIVKLVSE